MRFTIKKDKFLEGLQIAGHAIGSKNANQILMFLKLELTSKGLEITASDGSVSIWTLVPKTIGDKEIIRNESLGATLVTARILTEVVKRFDGEEISFEVVDNAVAKLDDGKSTFKLVCANADEYPDIDLAANGSPLQLSAADVSRLADQTAFASSTKDNHAILMAINLKAEGGRLTATATDGARLSRKFVEIESDHRFSVNVPAKVFTEICRLFKPGDEVNVNPSTERIVFSFGNTVVSSRLITGEYPVSNAIIPTNFNFYLKINANELLRALERVSILLTDNPVVKLSMTEDEVMISSREEQTGSGVEHISAVQYAGDRLDISFNATYVTDAVKALGSEDVTISFVGEMKPFVVKNPRDDSIIELITPMRTR